MAPKNEIMNFKMNNIPTQNGRIAIVTGANNGIGFETTISLAKYNAKIIMACRNLKKGNIAKEKILKDLPNADLKVMELDLSKPESVKIFAHQFKTKYDKLDILINNAGVLDYSGRQNQDGVEIQFATNHLGHFLLASLLIECMPDNEDSRIVSLSSVAHKSGKIHFDNINCENQSNKGAAYAQSKLACLMFGDELNRRLLVTGKKIKSITVHPGGSDSGLFADMSRIQYYILKILAPFITHSNASAAKPSIFAALNPAAIGGDYYGPTGARELKGKVGLAKRTDYSKREDITKKLWELSENITNTTFKI